MQIITQPDDPRIVEIERLAAEIEMPLALSPQTIVALEDHGYIADPFTAQIWPDPDKTQHYVWIDAYTGEVHQD